MWMVLILRQCNKSVYSLHTITWTIQLAVHFVQERYGHSYIVNINLMCPRRYQLCFWVNKVGGSRDPWWEPLLVRWWQRSVSCGRPGETQEGHVIFTLGKTRLYQHFKLPTDFKHYVNRTPKIMIRTKHTRLVTVDWVRSTPFACWPFNTEIGVRYFTAVWYIQHKTTHSPDVLLQQFH